MKRRLFAALQVLCAGCRTVPLDSAPPPPILMGVYAEAPVVVDGRLDEPLWQRAPAYALARSAADCRNGTTPTEPGTVRLAWNAEYLYAAFEFTDSDVIEEGDADQLQQQKTGDVGELFLKPPNETWYWEFHVTPRGRKSAFFFPGKGRWGLPSGFDYQSGLMAAAMVDGTLNNWQDRDRGWTAELAIPVRELTARGERFGPDSEWRVLAARYNYSRYLPEKELSSAPGLPRTGFHDLEHYARLRLLPPAPQGDQKR
jgi:hypothetical protein